MSVFIVMEKETGWQMIGGFMIKNKSKLHFHFHNSNSAEETANYMAKLFVEVNLPKVDRILQEAAEKEENT